MSPMAEYCPICDHELTMNRCWRLSCPSNGGRDSFRVTRPGPFHRNAPKEEGKLL